VEVLGLSETPVNVYRATRRHITAHHSLSQSVIFVSLEVIVAMAMVVAFLWSVTP
jgi:hypothetical protein